MPKKSVVEGGRLTGLGIVLVISMILIFMLLTFDQDMALIYLLMLSTYYFWWKNDDNITLPVEKSADGRFLSLIYGFAIFILFMVIASGIGMGSLGSILDLFGTKIPIFAGNKILTFISWGILIPVIETALFFGIFFEGLAYYVGKFMMVGPISTKFKPTNFYLWGIILAIAGIFTAYHFQTRGLTNNIGLLTTFIFAIISCWTVSYFGQTREAIFFHISTNSFAVLSNFGVFKF